MMTGFFENFDGAVFCICEICSSGMAFPGRIFPAMHEKSGLRIMVEAEARLGATSLPSV
jgi:hypothetical protein